MYTSHEEKKRPTFVEVWHLGPEEKAKILGVCVSLAGQRGCCPPQKNNHKQMNQENKHATKKKQIFCWFLKKYGVISCYYG